MGISSNRTYWPVQGGAVAIQPGWFQGHSKAFIYINMGLGTIPPNYSHPVVPPFQILGPSNNPYDGAGICLPQVPTPTNITVSPGDNATIQVVEAAQHGAALYSVSSFCRNTYQESHLMLVQCVDITFTDDMSLVQTVNDTNCRNDTNTISFATIFTTESLTAKAKTSAAIIIQTPKILGALSTAILAGAAYLAL